MLQNLVEFLKWLIIHVNLKSLFVCVGLVDVYHVGFRARPHVEAQRAGLCVLRHLGVPSQELQELRSHPGFDNVLDQPSVHQTPPSLGVPQASQAWWSCLTDGSGPFRHSLLAIGPLLQPGAGEFPHRGKQAEHAYDEQSNRQDGYLKQRVRAWVMRPDSEIPEEPAAREHHQQAYRTERDLVSRYHEADVAAGHVDPPVRLDVC